MSLSSIFIKRLDNLGLPLLTTAALRMTLAAIVLSPALLRGRRAPGEPDPSRLSLTALSGLLLGIHFGTWTLSLGKISIARSVLLVSTHPVFTALGEAAFLGRRLRPRELAGALLAFAGIAGMVAAGETIGPGTAEGDALALTGAVAISGYFLLGRRLRARVGLFEYVTPLYAVAALALLAAAVTAGSWRTPDSLEMWSLLAGVVIFPTLLGHAVMSWAIRHLPATAISTAFLGEAIGAAILAWIFFHQVPGTATWIGGGVTLAGIWIVFTSRR
jgi:drug/metabolite transporter (DMT)-like permease